MVSGNNSLCDCIVPCMVSFLNRAGTIAGSYTSSKDTSHLVNGGFLLASGVSTLAFGIVKSVKPLFQKKIHITWSDAADANEPPSSKKRNITRQLAYNAPFLFLGSCAVITGMIQLFSPGETNCTQKPYFAFTFQNCARIACEAK